MPLNKSETFDMVRSEVHHYSVANDLEKSVSRIANHSCVEMVRNGLMIKPDASVESYTHLVLELSKMYLSGQIKDILFKLYLGDAANQAEDIFGERSYQAYSNAGEFTFGTMNVMRWVAKRVPPENREIVLKSYAWLQFIAPLEPEEQARWNEVALQMKNDGDRGWAKKVKAMVNDEKIKEMIFKLPEDEREHWELLVEQYAPSWTLLRMWIRGDKEAPPQRCILAQWIKDKLSGVNLGADERDELVTIMHDLAEGLKHRQIVVEA